jgi:hypothetical protein
MIVCPNCNHQNPDGAVQCEACYTPLPGMISCPNCGTSVQADASFCGQCGFNLKSNAAIGTSSSSPATPGSNAPDNASDIDIPDLMPPDPLVSPEPLSPVAQSGVSEVGAEPMLSEPPLSEPPLPMPAGPSNVSPPAPPSPPEPGSYTTRLQHQTAHLLHIQTNTLIEIPQNLSIVHLGKPNDRIPPDVDVSGFPNSEIVSRIHADIRVEGDIYYIEDVGSSNGTYVNNLPLPIGNRHRLRPGDRIALGKGDKVSFIFQLS